MNRFSLSLAFGVLLSCVLGAATVQADAPVWKISKGGNHFYLGGTIHLLSLSDYPLPAAFEQAYQDSSSLVFETDISASRSTANQSKLLRQLMYPPGENLQQKLSPETFAKLNAFYAERNVPASTIGRFKAGMTVMTLTLIEMRRNGLAEEGVDMFYMKKAKAENKALGELEELDTQMQFIADMGAGQEDEMIRQTLTDLEKMPELITEMKRAWRAGDNQALIDTGIKDWKQDFPNVYRKLLVDRNNNWMTKLKTFNGDKDVEFVLVGALHLVGEDGLLAKLAEQGHKLEQLP